MLCQNCHKNEATVHIQKIVDGQVTSFHLCEACAAKKGADDPDLPELNLAEVLFDLAGKAAQAASKTEKDDDPDTVIACPDCGWSLDQLRKTGYMGCPGCYKTFGPLIGGMLKNMHRGDRHVGKIPLSSGPKAVKNRKIMMLQREIEQLRKDLEEKVRHEEYEEAAVLRDRIQSLERQLHGNKEQS